MKKSIFVFLTTLHFIGLTYAENPNPDQLFAEAKLLLKTSIKVFSQERNFDSDRLEWKINHHNLPESLLNEISMNLVNNLLTQSKRSSLQKKHGDLLITRLENTDLGDPEVYPYHYIGIQGSNLSDWPSRPKETDFLRELLSKGQDWEDLSNKLRDFGYNGLYLERMPVGIDRFINKTSSYQPSKGDQVLIEYVTPPKPNRGKSQLRLH